MEITEQHEMCISISGGPKTFRTDLILSKILLMHVVAEIATSLEDGILIPHSLS